MTALFPRLALIALTLGACRSYPQSHEQLRGGTPAFASAPEEASQFALVPAIVFTSTRDDSTGEIYLMNSDGTNPRRLTTNTAGDAFAALSRDGKRIVFDSNRRRTSSEPANTSDLFVMNTDGTEQTFLIRGSSATWAPDSRRIAFHASASGTGKPIKADPGAATFDNDIFVADVDELRAHGQPPRNITNSPEWIDDDPDWSPDGRKIVFTRHSVTDNQINSVTAEIFVMNGDGTGLTRLTYNEEEERGPSWSPDGTRIVYSCRKGAGAHPYEICVMNADGSQQTRLTDNDVADLTPTFSPDGKKILFHRGGGLPRTQQLWTMNADGSAQAQLTFTTGMNLLANWGEVRVNVKKN